jgi:hypothetical protein
MMARRAMSGFRAAGLPLLAAMLVVGPPTVAGAQASAARLAAQRAPVVVELFTAQGCAACPQADAVLGDFASRKGVIALTFSVDYWDYLGWADTFAKPEFTARQRAYVSRMKLREIYTPEVVVGGRRETRGFDEEKVSALVKEAQARVRAQGQPGPRVAVLSKDKMGRPLRVTVGAGAVQRPAADVWLVRYDPSQRAVRVNVGENKGKTVSQENVVRELTRLGPWTGTARRYTVPAQAQPRDGREPSLSSVILVQAPKGGPILAAHAAP